MSGEFAHEMLPKRDSPGENDQFSRGGTRSGLQFELVTLEVDFVTPALGNHASLEDRVGGKGLVATPSELNGRVIDPNPFRNHVRQMEGGDTVGIGDRISQIGRPTLFPNQDPKGYACQRFPIARVQQSDG